MLSLVSYILFNTSYPVVLIIRIFLIFDLFISLRCNVAGETENEDDNILYLGLNCKIFDPQKIPIMRYAITDINIPSIAKGHCKG